VLISKFREKCKGSRANGPRRPMAACPGQRAPTPARLCCGGLATTHPLSFGAVGRRPTCVAHHFTLLLTTPPRRQREECFLLSSYIDLNHLFALRTVQHNAMFATQPSMSNWTEQAPGQWTRALLRLPEEVPSSRCRAHNTWNA
jgi:hypothetical protein